MEGTSFGIILKLYNLFTPDVKVEKENNVYENKQKAHKKKVHKRKVFLA